MDACLPLTRVVVGEGGYELQVLLHEGGLIHHGGAGRGHERHDDGGGACSSIRGGPVRAGLISSNSSCLQ